MKIASRVVFILSSKKFKLFEKLSYPVMAMYRIEKKKVFFNGIVLQVTFRTVISVSRYLEWSEGI